MHPGCDDAPDLWLGARTDHSAKDATTATARATSRRLLIMDPRSGLDATQQKKFAGTTSNDEKQQMFLDWRNRGLQRAVKDAAARHVRYAGMGMNHLEPLIKAGLPPDTHVYDDNPTQHTRDLQAIAVKQR